MNYRFKYLFLILIVKKRVRSMTSCNRVVYIARLKNKFVMQFI